MKLASGRFVKGVWTDETGTDRFTDKFLYPVSVAIIAGLLIGWVAPLFQAVTVPNIYKAYEPFGLGQIRAAGFSSIEVIYVCSGSVESGYIREVVLNNDAVEHEETSFVTSAGTTEIAISRTTPLLVKVSDPEKC
jgi:hypothetical protein